jgi:hypothetical protein
MNTYDETMNHKIEIHESHVGGMTIAELVNLRAPLLVRRSFDKSKNK